MRRLLAISILTLLAGAGAVQAAPPDPDAPGLSPDLRLKALVERVKIEQSKLRTLEADFLQRRESEFLAQPEEARGTFSYAAPDRVRWEYREPKPMTLVIRGNEMTTWYQDLDRADRMNVGRYSGQVLRYLGASGSLETLLEYFRLSVAFPKAAGEPYRLELQPRYERMQKRLASMTLWLDRASFLPVRLKYVEAGGDITEYEFTNLRRNVEIPAARFDLELPPGVEVRTLPGERPEGKPR
ncbi:MAG TPA: outer membrane lipoprotein carrier protein LolA [Thermoanaerobaculia bacterium]|nr:outer membrane lipoprotein carrier protein LolA [Thermoanaerobaculia bacterium]